MFGMKNFTAVAFVAKIGKIGFEFSIGIVEEVTFNITTSTAANAAEIPQDMNLKLISKDQFVASTSAVVSSQVSKTKLFDLIAGATFTSYI